MVSTFDRPLFPPVIDSTILAAFRACPQKAFRQYVEHWKPATESVHLVAGGAFAKGIEDARDAFYVQGLPADECEAIGLESLIRAYGDFECPEDSAKSLTRMCGALEFYLANYPLGQDGADPITLANGRKGIEFSFAEPLPIAHPETGDPLIFAGRADMIAHFANGVYLFDEKTTSSLGPSWSRQWEMRSQFTGYTWAARQAGIDVAGTIIRGVSILKTKYDTQQAITNRAPWEVDRWLDQTCRDLTRMIAMWRDGRWDYNLDNACNDYGGCSLQRVCKSPTPESWLPVQFVKRVWDPLSREEVPVEQWEAQWRGVKTPEITNL